MTASVSDVVGKIEGDLGVLAVQEAGRRAAAPGLEPGEPVAPGGGAERDVDRAARAEAACGLGQGACRDEHDVVGVGGGGVPVQLAHREAVPVGGEQRHRVAVDLDPDPGEDRQGVAAVGRDRDLGNGLGEEVPVDRARGLGAGGQGRVVVRGHHEQAEAGRPARDLDLAALGDDVDRAVGQVARDVGEEAAEDEHRAGLRDVGGDGDPGRDLVVERAEGEGAVVRCLEQDAGQDRDRGAGGQPAGHPGDRLGQDVALDAELHGYRPIRRVVCAPTSRAVSCNPRPRTHRGDPESDGRTTLVHRTVRRYRLAGNGRRAPRARVGAGAQQGRDRGGSIYGEVSSLS